MCPQAEMNVQRHHMGRRCWRGFIWCFQTALGSVLQEPFWFSFLCFKTHGFLLKYSAKRKRVNYKWTMQSYSPLFLSLPSLPPSVTHTSLCVSHTHTHTHTHTHSEDKHSTSVCVSTEIDATVNSQDLWNHIPRIWDHRLY